MSEPIIAYKGVAQVRRREICGGVTGDASEPVFRDRWS